MKKQYTTPSVTAQAILSHSICGTSVTGVKSTGTFTPTFSGNVEDLGNAV